MIWNLRWTKCVCGHQQRWHTYLGAQCRESSIGGPQPWCVCSRFTTPSPAATTEWSERCSNYRAALLAYYSRTSLPTEETE